MELEAVVLAGGRSRRMGRDKALLPFGETTLAGWVIARIRPAVRGVIVVAPDPAPFAADGVRVVADVFPGMGPLAGLHAGLLAARAPACLAVACDMPFASPDLARQLGETLERTGADAAAPVWNGRPEPLFAVYRRRVAAVAEAMLRTGGGRLADLLARLEVAQVTERELAAFGDPALLFMNVNRPEELDQARRLLAPDFPPSNQPNDPH